MNSKSVQFARNLLEQTPESATQPKGFESMKWFALVAFGWLWSLPAIAQPTPVVNGGFETGDFTGWTQSGYTDENYVDTYYEDVHSGIYGASFGPVGTLGFISQVLQTTPGQAYRISAWLDSADGRLPSEFNVAWDGVGLFDVVNLPAFGWTNVQLIAVASSPNTILQFGFRDDPSYLGFDDVSVVPLGSPDGRPVAITDLASEISLVSAKLNGTVVPKGRARRPITAVSRLRYASTPTTRP